MKRTMPTMVRSRFLALALVIIASVAGTRAQSSFFNIPTSNVLAPGESYVEADFDAKLSRFRDGGWQSYGIFAIHGLKKRTEIGVNAYFARSADGFETVELQPNVKHQFHENEKYGTSVAGGIIAYMPIKRSILKETTASVYLVGGKRFRSEWAPRFTGGGYQLLGKRDGGDSRGFMFAVEQPVHRRVSVIVDWNSGKNRFGYASAGFTASLTKRTFLSSAYYFGNEGHGNSFLGIYYGVSF